MEPEVIEPIEYPDAAPAQLAFDRSLKVGELMAALAKAQGEYEAATKDSSNPYYNSKYADLATIIGAVRPSLAKHGIAFFHTVSCDLDRQTAGATSFLFFGDQYISTALEVPAVGKTKDGKDRFDAQTIGAAQTYCRRYTAASLLGIAQEDDDGNTVVRDDAKRTTPAQATRQQAAKPAQATPAQPDAAVVRAGFFARTKELGWGLNDVKKFIVKAYPEAQGSTAKLTDEQLSDALKIMADNKPADYFAMTEQPAQ